MALGKISDFITVYFVFKYYFLKCKAVVGLYISEVSNVCLLCFSEEHSQQGSRFYPRSKESSLKTEAVGKQLLVLLVIVFTLSRDFK